uniref:CSON009140 protein n=1 Tax=Culicoides sonorensis TaxID=179676 RepID=A0A336MZL0_CULSO
MAESWHIPRASLGSNSTSSSSVGGNSSHSGSRKNSSTSCHHPHIIIGRQPSLDEIYSRNSKSYTNRGYQQSNKSDSVHSNEIRRESEKIPKQRRTREGNVVKSRMDELRERFDETSNNNAQERSKVSGLKRGSRSSQGSTDSNHSSHSASSGSLLLTAANLENHARIHHNKNRTTNPLIKEEDGNEISSYAANITMSNGMKTLDSNLKRVPDIDTITIDIPSNALRPKMGRHHGKDFDSMSIASSTHFTVVNGIGRPPKVPKSGLCDRGHQITVLIVTMSIFFMIGISLAVYFMEMRAREMPNYN